MSEQTITMLRQLEPIMRRLYGYCLRITSNDRIYDDARRAYDLCIHELADLFRAAPHLNAFAVNAAWHYCGPGGDVDMIDLWYRLCLVVRRLHAPLFDLEPLPPEGE